MFIEEKEILPINVKLVSKNYLVLSIRFVSYIATLSVLQNSKSLSFCTFEIKRKQLNYHWSLNECNSCSK